MTAVRKLVLAAAWAAVPGLAVAQQAGSMDDQIACTPDVYRLCSSLIPNEDAIVQCLERNKPSLSPACKQVFSRPASAKHDADPDDE